MNASVTILPVDEFDCLTNDKLIINMAKLPLYLNEPGAEFTINTKKIPHRKWQDYVYIQCEYKSTKQPS